MFFLISLKVSVLRLAYTQTAAAATNQSPIKKTLHPPSASLLYTVVNKEVEQ
jgi:hypothetical protein